jgi:ammonia channel protein AmtB
MIEFISKALSDLTPFNYFQIAGIIGGLLVGLWARNATKRLLEENAAKQKALHDQ